MCVYIYIWIYTYVYCIPFIRPHSQPHFALSWTHEAPSAVILAHHYCQRVSALSVIHGVAWSCDIYIERTSKLLKVPHNYAVIIRAILRTVFSLSFEDASIDVDASTRHERALQTCAAPNCQCVRQQNGSEWLYHGRQPLSDCGSDRRVKKRGRPGNCCLWRLRRANFPFPRLLPKFPRLSDLQTKHCRYSGTKKG